MFKKMMVYTVALVLVWFSLEASNIKWVNYVDPPSMSFMLGAMLLVFSRHSLKQWRQFMAVLRGKAAEPQQILLSQTMLQSSWHLLLGAVGVNLLFGLIFMFWDLQNLATMGAVIALWILSFIYVLSLYWLVFLPLNVRLERVALEQKLERAVY